MRLKNKLNEFRMGYKKIHACLSDYILYKKEYINTSVCSICKKLRLNNSKVVNDRGKKKYYAKMLWYFSPIL